MKIRPWRAFFLAAFIFALAGCQSAPPAFNFGAYSQAETLYEKKKFKEAIEKYDEYLQENPEGNMAVISAYYMAKSYEEIGQPDKAKAIYTDIITKHPGLVWANFAKERLEEISHHSQTSS